jgi:pyridoxal phosphate enzyme (YggS family)
MPETKIKENLEQIRRNISRAAEKAGRDTDDITLIAITKYVGIAEIRALIKLGVRDIGESRLQEALKKIPEINDEVRWHMVGHLQRNKVKKAVEHFEMIHSVDSPRLVREIANQASRDGRVVKILLQVNTSGEETKYGAPQEDVNILANAAVREESVEVLGLMTMAPYAEEPEEARPYFRELRLIRDRLRQSLGRPLPHLSMGMTADYEVAVEEGATMLRIGTALFK